MLQRSTTLHDRPSTAAGATPASTPGKLTRRRSRNATYSSPPPPLPLISLPPDDEWEEFDTPTRTGFHYSLPHLELASEEFEDASAWGSSSASISVLSDTGVAKKRDSAPPDHERLKICRLLSEYMAQNETFQTQRHSFGIDTRLVYKRNKDTDAAAATAAAAFGASSTSEDLSFDAFFESGNLDRAYRVNGRHYASSHELLGAATQSTSSATSQPPFAFFVKADMEYDLYCDTDINTHGHIQWYFFRTTLSLAPTAAWRQHAHELRNNNNNCSSSSRLSVRFNIRNMLKRASLYNDGMLPTVYIDAPSASRRGWHHAGTNVCYFKNAETYRSRKTGKVQSYYTLSFVYEFDVSGAPATPPPSHMVVYFAHCYPYTYTRLQRFLLSLQKDADRSRYIKRRVLCKTIAGNNCDLLTITDFSQEDSSDQPYATKRTGIVLTARVHPGESNSSFVMHGILDFLTGASLEARYLRHHFVFKVVPMLNPDGVVHGNYRCSLAGTDLNRRWMQPSAELHPTILATKNAILSMKTTRPVSLYVDIHGHSRKKNIFLYGCKPFDATNRTEAARLRLFPHLLGKTSSALRGGFYSFSDCTFSVSNAKKGTGRVVVWKEAEVLHSFTLETSFFGVGPNKKQQQLVVVGSSTGASSALTSSSSSSRAIHTVLKHFTPYDLRMAGTKFCHALLPFAQVIHLDRVAAAEDQLRAVASPLDTEMRSSPPAPANPRGPEATVLSPLPLPAAASPRSSDNKLRLAPLAPLPGCTTARAESDEVLRSCSPTAARSPPKQAVPRSPTLQFLSSPFDAPALTSSSPASMGASAFSAGGLPSEFDALFADDSMSALLALSDPDDLLKEIEATLPDVLADDASEDGSVGSESDPSGDNMEDEELQSANTWTTILPTASTASAVEPTPKLPRTRPLRVMRHLSEPRLYVRSLLLLLSLYRACWIATSPLCQAHTTECTPLPSPLPLLPCPDSSSR